MTTDNIDKYLNEDDILVNLKTLQNGFNLRVLPKTISEAIIETEEKQFISKNLKNAIYNKQDNLGFEPVNKAGDVLTGALSTNYNVFTDNNQFVTKQYVDKKFNDLIGSSSEALDTIYELGEALNNDPNFAVTITQLISNKVNSSEVTNLKEGGKIPRLDSEGELIVNTKGNAKTASSLANPFTLSLTGDVQSSTSIDGSGDVNLNIVLPVASIVSSGIISASDYIRFNQATKSIAFNIDFWLKNSTTELYEAEFPLENDDVGKIGIIQTFKNIGDNIFHEIKTSYEIYTDKILVTSMIPFNGKIVYTTI